MYMQGWDDTGGGTSSATTVARGQSWEGDNSHSGVVPVREGVDMVASAVVAGDSVDGKVATFLGELQSAENHLVSRMLLLPRNSRMLANRQAIITATVAFLQREIEIHSAL